VDDELRRRPSCEQVRTQAAAASMRTILCVAEKNSAAKEIVRVMCGSANANWTVRQGRNPVYEFPYTVQGQQCQILFTAVAGHLKGHGMGDNAGWGDCPHRDLLDVSKTHLVWFVAEDKVELADQLRQLSRRANSLVLWLDCDSEGEKIAYDVADVCKRAESRLVVRRARFSAMTRPEITRAWSNLVDLDARVIAMVETRQELDTRAGFAFTRFLTDAGKQFDLSTHAGEGGSVVISYGPCQSPALGLVVDRQLTIDNFRRRPFWTFRLRLAGCDCPFEWARSRLFEEYSSHLLYELCVEDAAAMNNCARVERVDAQGRNRMRPVPLATVELQKAASRLLHISSDRSVAAAEALYASGLISYPRTETDEFEESYDLRSMVELQRGDRPWGAFAARLLTPAADDDPVTFNWPRSGGNNDRAHPPIHPTAPAPATFADADQRAVYEYVARRFLAACSIDAQGGETKVQVRVGRAELFGARGLVVKVKGYLEVMRYESWSNRSMPVQLLDQGAMIPVDELTMQKSETKPPPLLSEADLIALMDRHGIGTDATIAQHVKRIIERHYVRRQPDGRFKPLPLGIALVEALERSRVQLARPGMRKAQEAEFKKIQAGQVQGEAVKLQALAQFRTSFQKLEANVASVSAAFGGHFPATPAADASDWSTERAEFSACGVCGRMMALKSKALGVNRWCAVHCGHCSSPSTYVLSKSVGRKTYAAVHGVGQTCPICHFQVVSAYNPDGRKTHRFCPCCLHRPPGDRALNPKGEVPGQFRCFMCSHSACPNAADGREEDVARCPCATCDLTCGIRFKVGQGFRVACSSSRDSPSCDWKPYFFPDCTQCVQAAGGPDATCHSCSSKRLNVTWKSSAVVPGQSPTFVGCIWCGGAYRAVLDQMGYGAKCPSYPHPGAPAAADLEGYGRGTGRGRGRGTRGRGAATAQRGRGRGSHHRGGQPAGGMARR
jgi:DNA topoisomerase III